MDLNPYIIPSLWVIGATSVSLLVVRENRATSILLSIQYVGVFILVGFTWPVEMAVIKLVVGWLAAAVLGLEIRDIGNGAIEKETNKWSLVLLIIGLAILLIFAMQNIIPGLAKRFLSASYEQIFGCIILAAMGVLKVGITDTTRGVVIGILTFLSGFEILYSTIETSGFVAGYLAFFSLGIVILGSYLSAAPSLQSDQ